MSRILKLFKSRSEPGLKGKTIQKAAPGVQIRDHGSVHVGAGCKTTNEDRTFSREYYTPRPVPRSFVVGEVRKVSDNGSSPESLKSQDKEASPEVPKSSKPAAAPRTISTQSDHLGRSPTPAPKSGSPNESGAKPPPRQTTTSNRKPPSNGVNGEPHPRSTFNLLLGQQDPSSLYFTRRYFDLPDLHHADSASGSPSDALHQLSELDPQAFEIYKAFLRTRRIGFRCPEDVKAEYIWMACWPLMNTHILGCIIEEPDFADRVMDVLVEKLIPGIPPDIETVDHLFEGNEKNMPGVLKQFVIDRFLDAQQQACNLLETSNYQTSFKLLTLQAALQRLSQNSNTTAKSICKYHTHGTSEACYKTRFTPIDMLRDRRLAAAREMSTKDAGMVMANVMQNGVKTVDWEERRSDASRALRVETGRKWVGFRRVEGGKSVEGADAVKQRPSSINGGDIDMHSTDQVRSSKDKPRLTNAVTGTFDLIRTPNNSPVHQNGHREVDAAAIAVPAMQTRNEQPDSGNTVSRLNSPGHGPHAFAPAELHGSTVYDVPHLMNIMPRYQPGINRVPDTRGQTSQTLVVVNSTQHLDASRSQPNGSTSEPENNVDKAVVEHERRVSCPGAYPESNVGM